MILPGVILTLVAVATDAKSEAARRGLVLVGGMAIGLVAASVILLLAMALRRAFRRGAVKAGSPPVRNDPWLEAGKRAEPETRYLSYDPEAAGEASPGDSAAGESGSWDRELSEAGEGGPPLGDRPVALVTGGAKRVGLAIADALAAAGCDIIITYNTSVDAARRASESLMQRGAAVRLVRVDLSDDRAVTSAGAKLAAELPRLNVLVHNASVYGASPLDQMTAETATLFWRVNALAPLLLTKQLAPLLARSPRPGGGSIVALADIHSMGRPRKGFAAYSMSKAALVEMVQTLSRELAPAVRVNGVAPGVVAWPDDGPDSDKDFQKAYLARVPLGRAGTPEDAAAAVRWLALEAPYVTGQIVRVDGGRWLG